MAITRSQIARQLLAEGGVSLDDAKMMAPEGEFLAYINPKEAGILRSMGGSGKMTPMGIPSFTEDEEDQLAMDAPDYSSQDLEEQAAIDAGEPTAQMSTMARDFQGFGGGDNLSDLQAPTFFQNVGAGLSNLIGQGRRGQNILNFLNRSTANTMRGRLGLGRRGDINYILEQLQSNKGDPVAIGLTDKQFEIGQKLIDAGIKDETDIRNMTQSQFDTLFPGPQTGGDGDSEPIRKLKAPITEDKKEEPKDEFDDILKFYGARFAEGGSPGNTTSQRVLPRTDGRRPGYYGSDAGFGDDDYKDESAAFDAGSGSGGSDQDFAAARATIMGPSTYTDDSGNTIDVSKLQKQGYNKYDLAEMLGPLAEIYGLEQQTPTVAGPLGTTRGGLAGLGTESATGRGTLTSPDMGQVQGTNINVKDVQPTSGYGGKRDKKTGEALGDFLKEAGPDFLESLAPYGGPRRSQADGGEVRQDYFGGGITKALKKATGALKKVAKSPLGKAALAFGAYKLAGSPKIFGEDSFIGKLTADKALKGILGASLAAGLYAKKEEEDETLPTVSNTDPEFQKYLAFYGGPRRFAAEGGMMEQDEMLNLGGNEMDLRGGGFVPLGEYEKKDDVPARLSKNEFVMTADAVRAAGGGSVDRGADIMYKTMKTLENKVA